jgi:hypothetical protein
VRGLLEATGMQSVDRCEAYAATRRAARTVERAVRGWPTDLAQQAMTAANKAVSFTAEGSVLDPSAQRRRCARSALAAAIEVAAACDIARALGLHEPVLEDALRENGRAIALLGLFFRASIAGGD